MMASASNDQGNAALRAFARRLNLDDRLEPFHDRRWRNPDENAPVLHLEDVSAIPFLSGIAGVEEYQHRARVRAYDGDLYATVTPTDPAYEAYCRDWLNLGDVRWFRAEGGGTSRSPSLAPASAERPLIASWTPRSSRAHY